MVTGPIAEAVMCAKYLGGEEKEKYNLYLQARFKADADKRNTLYKERYTLQSFLQPTKNVENFRYDGEVVNEWPIDEDGYIMFVLTRVYDGTELIHAYCSDEICGKFYPCLACIIEYHFGSDIGTTEFIPHNGCN